MQISFPPRGRFAFVNLHQGPTHNPIPQWLFPPFSSHPLVTSLETAPFSERSARWVLPVPILFIFNFSSKHFCSSVMRFAYLLIFVYPQLLSLQFSTTKCNANSEYRDLVYLILQVLSAV